MHSQQDGFGFVAQQRAVRQRAGGDDAQHFALDRAFAGDFADLLANRH